MGDEIVIDNSKLPDDLVVTTTVKKIKDVNEFTARTVFRYCCQNKIDFSALPDADNIIDDLICDMWTPPKTDLFKKWQAQQK